MVAESFVLEESRKLNMLDRKANSLFYYFTWKLTFLTSGNQLETVAQLNYELSRIQRFFPENRYHVSTFNETEPESLSTESDRAVF